MRSAPARLLLLALLALVARPALAGGWLVPPYRLDVLGVFSPDRGGSTIFADVDGDGDTDHVQLSPGFVGISRLDGGTPLAAGQCNFTEPGGGIHGMAVAWDGDADGTLELVVARHDANDSWLEVVPTDCAPGWELVRTPHEDRNGDGNADHRYAFAGVEDTDGDGVEELWVVSTSGYDRGWRGVLRFSPGRSDPDWRAEIPGVLKQGQTHPFARVPRGVESAAAGGHAAAEERWLVIGDASVGNGYSSSRGGDDVSRVWAVTPRGVVAWSVPLAGVFAEILVEAVDLDGDGEDEVAASVLAFGQDAGQSALVILRAGDGHVLARHALPDGPSALAALPLANGAGRLVVASSRGLVRSFDVRRDRRSSGEDTWAIDPVAERSFGPESVVARVGRFLGTDRFVVGTTAGSAGIALLDESLGVLATYRASPTAGGTWSEILVDGRPVRAACGNDPSTVFDPVRLSPLARPTLRTWSFLGVGVTVVAVLGVAARRRPSEDRPPPPLATGRRAAALNALSERVFDLSHGRLSVSVALENVARASRSLAESRGRVQKGPNPFLHTVEHAETLVAPALERIAESAEEAEFPAAALAGVRGGRLLLGEWIKCLRETGGAAWTPEHASRLEEAIAGAAWGLSAIARECAQRLGDLATVARLAAGAHRADGVRIRLVGGDGPLWVVIPAERLAPAVENLVANAIRACAGRASSEVRLSLIRDEERGRAILRVEDDGPGVPAPVRSRLFQGPVRSRDGTGRGLYVSRRALLEWDADIVLERDGDPTVFELLAVAARVPPPLTLRSPFRPAEGRLS